MERFDEGDEEESTDNKKKDDEEKIARYSYRLNAKEN